MKDIAKTGNEAVAEAMRQINPDVVAAYPITPATEIVQIFSQFVADGLVKTEYVAVESEHSAMSACIGASAAGARAMTGTSSQGLALMWEMLYIAAGLRMPIVMGVANRALSSPINIHGDQSDVMGTRDSGWIQLHAENTQEAYDNIIQAVKIAETAKLPVISTMDGFIISHCMEVVKLLEDAQVQAFVGDYKPERYLLDVDNPFTLGAIDLQDYYFEHRRQLADAMVKSKDIVLNVGKEFGKKFGREYGLWEKVNMDDAELALVVIGSAAGTAKNVISELRKQGKKVGMLKLRVFRPFAADALAEELKNVKSVAVLDRSDSCDGFGGPIFDEVRSALYDLDKRPLMTNYIYGLGGREFDLNDIRYIYEELGKILSAGKVGSKINYIGVRE
ncbi:MAG: pyruvate ferredoxin oxidoreductase [Elusimicrobiota bacterium]